MILLHCGDEESCCSNLLLLTYFFLNHQIVLVAESPKVSWNERVACKAEITLNINLSRKPEKKPLDEDLKLARASALKGILLEQDVRISIALVWSLVGRSGDLF
jgi:hypothetical protein